MRTGPEIDAGFEAEFPHLLALAMRVCTRLLRDRAEAEDAAAEALARTAMRWSRVGGLEHRDAWVQRVAANVAIDVLRRRRVPAGDAEPLVPDHADPALGRIHVDDLLRRLPRRQREVMVLRYVLDLSTEETALALAISPNSVKKHVSRATTTLREHVGTTRKDTTVAL